jgi:hypothetical protein
MKKILFFIFLISFSLLLNATVLGDLAAGMQPGTWVEITGMGNFDGDLFTDGCPSGILAFSECAVWNPASEELYFLGSGPGFTKGETCGRFVRYRSRENQWDLLPKPTLFSGTHSYDHNTLDPGTQTLYHRPYKGTTIYQYHIPTARWSALPRIPDNVIGYVQVAGALEYFPEMNGLIFINSSRALYFNFSNKTWSILKSNLQIGNHSCFAEYNPVAKVVIFGGGNDSYDLYKIYATGQVTKMQDTPFIVRSVSTVTSVDVTTGKYIVLWDSQRFYEYDVITDTWTKLNNPPAYIFNWGNDPGMIIATPISNFGVNMYVKNRTGTAGAYLYKHDSGATRISEQMVHSGSVHMLTVSPNPFNSAVDIKIDNKASVAIYDIHGRMVSDLSNQIGSNRIHWTATTQSPGIYVIKAKVGNKTLTQKIILAR